jgi:hypothetical protein
MTKGQTKKQAFLIFDIDLTFACLREVPPCGTKAGILSFDIALSLIGI